MTFVDPDTNMVINCTPWEYEQLKPKFIKTEWTTYTKEVKDGK